MTAHLEIPSQFHGKWEHMLILTYGADIPFFEKVLCRDISARCKNRIILADGNRLIEISKSLAETGLARYINQTYILDGIFTSNAAHAKLVLLTNSEEGRLLVGSGNLSMQGYASGGELFTVYDYSREHSETLAVFISIRNFLEKLIEKYLIGPTTIRHIEHLFQNSPWLYFPVISEEHLIRHNLERNFLDQLIEAVGDESVDELWVMAPFYDPKAISLQHLLEKLNPKEIGLLVQKGSTSVDPTALKQVIKTYPEKIKTHTFHIVENLNSNVHAKLYVAKTPTREICLQGSPNLSQVAMLRSGSSGNIELANLIVGERGYFDNLFNGIDIHPETQDIEALELAYLEPEEKPTQSMADFYLTRGEWVPGKLTLFFRGQFPDVSNARILVDQIVLPIKVLSLETGAVDVHLNNKWGEIFSKAVPVAIQWGNDDHQRISNPIFVCNRTTLDDQLAIVDVDVPLESVGELDLDDEKLEALLNRLDSNLVIDRQSVWRLAKKDIPKNSGEDDEVLRLDYTDIDYAMLRQHPKLRIYSQRNGVAGELSYTRSPLQALLGSITGHFKFIIDVQTGKVNVENISSSEEGIESADTEEEQEEQDRETRKKKLSSQKRIRNIFTRFIRRYLRGICSPDFQEFAGFDVLVKNYVIFSHILWRLFFKEWMDQDHEFIIESLQKMWAAYWGAIENDGYFQQLTLNEQKQSLQFMRENRSEALLLGSLYHSSRYCYHNSETELRIALRNSWRHLLQNQFFEITDQILLETWVYLGSMIPYNTPTPTVIVNELESLAQFETTTSFLRYVEKRFGMPEKCCRFDRQNVYRESISKTVSAECLVIGHKRAMSDKNRAVAILKIWRKFRKLDYYRIVSPDHQRLLIYDAETEAGLYHIKHLDKTVEFQGLDESTPMSWESPLYDLEFQADIANEMIRLDNVLELISNHDTV